MTDEARWIEAGLLVPTALGAYVRRSARRVKKPAIYIVGATTDLVAGRRSVDVPSDR